MAGLTDQLRCHRRILPLGACPVCFHVFALRKDDTLWAHHERAGLSIRCKGTGQPALAYYGKKPYRTAFDRWRRINAPLPA